MNLFSVNVLVLIVKNRFLVKLLNIWFSIALVTITNINAQNFNALNGSSYSGAASIFNNPASPNNSLQKWDLNIFAIQLSNITNTIYAKNLQLPSLSNTSIQLTQGSQSRYNHQSVDINLFNAMYQIDKKQTIAGGIRLRSYSHLKTNTFESNDSISSLNQFLINNRTAPYMQGFATQSGWLEGNLNYSKVIHESSEGRLSGGITLQILKNVSGAYSRINRISYLETKSTIDTSYTFTGGSGSFAYSANYDLLSDNISLQGNINQMIKAASGGVGLSLGIEYVAFDKDAIVGENEPKPYYWKLGFSIMDIGASNYKTSQFTGQFSDPNKLLTDRDISNKITNINSSRDLRDSLATLFNNVTALPNSYTINSPTRMIINIDRALGNHFFANFQLSMNFRSASNLNKLNTRELNLLTITPRWETNLWGIYFPMQYNTQGNFWMGTAIKLGPLTAGIHSLGILKKDPLLNGGGYLMISIHPFQKRTYSTRLDCF